MLHLMPLTFAATAFATLPPQTLQLNLTRVINQTAYAVDMQFGTPPQKLKVLVDTGSPFLGIPGTNSNWCTLPKKPCAQYGSYNNLTSSTAKYISDEFNNALINHGLGDYIQDVIRLGGQTYRGIEFGMILNYAASFPAPDMISGLVGLVPFCFTNGSCVASPPTTLQQNLVKRGYLKKNSVAVYLGPEKSNATGQLLFGAIDRAKQLDKPVTFSVIPPNNPVANSSPNLANVSSFAVFTKSSSGGNAVTQRNFKISPDSFGILDTGFPGWSLPHPVWTYVKKYLGVSGDSDPYAGTYPVDCKFRKPQADGATLVIGFAKDSLKIRVPMERLVTQLAPGKCVTPVSDCGADGEGCGFGDPFLRSTYISFDFDALTVTMSNAKYTDKTDIVAA